ncbi:MAG: Holliday junction resolvase RuvX [Candidatus Zixiibacteriota bacterium]
MTKDETFIGIDYGTRRIGLAKSDPSGLIASALTTIEVTDGRDAIEKISIIIKEHQPVGLVIGYPLSMSGKKSGKCHELDQFMEQLRKIYSGPIYRVDERLSTAEAERILHAHGKKVGQDKKRLDRLSAVIILQRFLDERRRHETHQ